MIDFAPAYQGPHQKVSLTKEFLRLWSIELENNKKIPVEYDLTNLGPELREDFVTALKTYGFTFHINGEKIESNCPANVGRALLWCVTL